MATDAQGDGITALTQSPRLTQRLWQVVRAKRRFFTARALVLASLACLLLAAVIIGADIVFAFGPAGRWLTFVLVVLAMLLILTVRLVLPWRRYHEHQAVRDLESACAGVGQLLRTSAEIAREGDAKAFSPALSRALIRQAEETLATAPMARVIPWPTLRRWGLALAALALAFALAVLLWPDFRRGAIRLALPAAQVTFTHLDVAVSPAAFERGQTVRVDARLSGRPTAGVGLDLRLPRSGWVVTPMTQASDGTWSAEFAGLTQSFEIRLRAGDARCRQRIRFIDPPAVQSAAVQVDYPAYTRLPATQGPLQDLRLPEGAKARFTFALNHPLTHAAVILPDGKRQALETGGAALVWEWTATPGLQAFSLAGEDAEGLPLKAFGWEVRGTPDQRPQVTLLEPAEDISLTPIGETPIVARIQDDFGIAQAEIILTVDGKEQRLAGQEPAEAPRQLRLTHDLRLEDLALAPGSSVRLHARARDLLPERPGWSVSDIRVITIRPLKILRRPGEPKPPESGRKEDELKQDIATLQQAIERQKDAVQETLQRREEQPDSRQPLPETAAAERELAQVVNDLADRAAAAAPPPPAATPATPATPPPSAPAPALEQAEQQLQAAAEALTKPDLNTALRREDQALSAMVQARDLLQQQLEEQQAAAAQQPNAPQAAQAQPPPTETLEQLAERAEALARTEQAVRNAVAPTPAPAPANPPPAGAPPPAPDAPAQPVPTPADAPPAAPAQDQVAQTAPPPAAQAPALPPPAPTPAPATPQQQAAVQQAEELAADIRQNPRTTTLASQRMAAAGETMDKALRDLRAADPQAAAQELAQAQEQLETIATHLRGLDPARAAETLERAARLAEEAARQLSPPPADPAADPATDPATAATVPPTPAPAEPAATPPDAPASEQVARTAETVDDWLKRLATEPAKDPEAIQNPLRELRRTLRTDSLADQVAQAAQDRQEGRTEQARQAEQDAAERFEQMAKGLTQERQRLVRGRLEQLAAAEATAKALQNELNGAEKPAPTEAKDTAAKLREFAGQLQDLRDTPLDRAARELRDQVPPPNQPGPAPQGGKIPERVRQEVLPGAVVRLRTLIDEMVQRELLVDRDARIPEQYNGLVESYFKAISDEQK